MTDVEVVSELSESLTARQTDLLIKIIEICVKEGAPKDSLGALYAAAFTRKIDIEPWMIEHAKRLEKLRETE